VPPLQADREAMVSATIHLANRDWDALIDDFVALGFLPRGCDRGAPPPPPGADALECSAAL
jgi:hypothetical protein